MCRRRTYGRTDTQVGRPDAANSRFSQLCEVAVGVGRWLIASGVPKVQNLQVLTSVLPNVAVRRLTRLLV